MGKGRALKDGLDYFSMDVHLDDKFQLLEAEHGLQGFAVMVKLLQKIYGGSGYYCDWTEEVALLFARSCGLDCNAVKEIVATAARRGLIDARLLDEFGIITSSGIQKRYLDAVERRKSVKIIKEYLLLSVPSIPSNVDIISINVDINSQNECNNSQSKVKESKVKESKCDDDVRPDFNTVEAYASSQLDFLSQRDMQDLITFQNDLPEELIRHAIDVACEKGVRKFSYVRKVLNRYAESGYRTVAEAKSDTARYEKSKQQPAPQQPERKIRWVF